MESVKQAVGLGGPRLSWIGLGNMGRGMVKNIVEKGQFVAPIQVYNRTTARSEKLVSSVGKSKVATLEETTDADIIFICLADDDAVTETVNTILPRCKGKLIVDCSTIHPDTTDKIAKTINDAGAEFVACPVFGAPAMADNGQLVCVLAGPKAQVDKVKPYCKGVMGRAEIDLSDQPYGTATRLKIVGNTFIVNMIESLSEGHVLAEKSGLGTKNLHAFVEALFPGPYTAYSNRMLSGDYYQREEPLFAVDLARKDARHAMNLAKAHGVRMKDVEVADAHLAMVKEHAGATGDIAGIYGAVRKENGLPYENQS
ncbi:hypothetical protein AMS68_006487 [Peltaster fructicola]|uniref:6-phosphogluconate dehydrogenase NADP-binding domain-containing protein n=1 Tax=Peltaster fructicola TaxID=286661 RepID=A0A6H0Y2V2_9PEZI|nr:hypothetical protein AMS68_006487 [Peltaster fructicola]